MNEQYVSPFAASAHEEKPTDGFAERYIESSQDGVNLTGHLQGVERQSWVGFRSPQPWDNATHEERRAAYGGYLFPSWYPFAALEGNYEKSEHFDASHFRAPKKVHGEIDEGMEARKKQFAVPMVTKASYTAHVPVGKLKRA